MLMGWQPLFIARVSLVDDVSKDNYVNNCRNGMVPWIFNPLLVKTLGADFFVLIFCSKLKNKLNFKGEIHYG